MLRFGFLLIVSTLSLSAAARATELKFTVDYGIDDPGVIETFYVNTSVPGILSDISAQYYDGTSHDINLAITDDSLGNTLLQVGDTFDSEYFATGTSDYSAFFTSPTYTGNLADAFYVDGNLYLQANAGQVETGIDGTTITVSSVPEPSSWTMLILGTGAIGAVLRRRRQGARVAA